MGIVIEESILPPQRFGGYEHDFSIFSTSSNTHLSLLDPIFTLLTTRDLGKKVIEALTVGKIKVVALYKGISAHGMDHFVQHLLYMVLEKKLNVMREDVNPTLILNRILFRYMLPRTFILLESFINLSHKYTFLSFNFLGSTDA